MHADPLCNLKECITGVVINRIGRAGDPYLIIRSGWLIDGDCPCIVPLTPRTNGGGCVDGAVHNASLDQLNLHGRSGIAGILPVDKDLPSLPVKI